MNQVNGKFLDFVIAALRSRPFTGWMHFIERQVEPRQDASEYEESDAQGGVDRAFGFLQGIVTRPCRNQNCSCTSIQACAESTASHWRGKSGWMPVIAATASCPTTQREDAPCQLADLDKRKAAQRLSPPHKGSVVCTPSTFPVPLRHVSFSCS